MSKNTKGSTFVITFFVVLVFAIFYLIYAQRDFSIGTTYQSRQTQQLSNEELGSSTESLKIFNEAALKVSMTRASFKSAANGCAQEPNRYWLRYGKKSAPTAGEAISSVNNLAQDELNNYLSEVNGYTFGTRQWFTQMPETAEVDINESDIILGTYDDGFSVVLKGNVSHVKSTISEDDKNFVNANTADLFPLRYWYLYRIMREYVMNRQRLEQYSCEALPGLLVPPTVTVTKDSQQSSEETQEGKEQPLSLEFNLTKILDIEISSLNAMFDGNVICNYTLICQHAAIKPIKRVYCCKYGMNPNINLNPTMDCLPAYDPTCKPDQDIEKEDEETKKKYNCDKTGEGVSVEIETQSPQVDYTFQISCKDLMYKSAVKKEAPDNLVLNVHMNVAVEKGTYSISNVCNPKPEE